MNAWDKTWIAVLALTATLIGACGDDSDDEEKDPIEIAGSWDNEFNGTETIDDQSWDLTFDVADIVEYDNDDNWAILYMPPDAKEDLGPDTFQRVVWTEPEDGMFYTCTVAFGFETLEEARASKAKADDSDPASSGCGMFSWSLLVEAED